MRELLGNSKNFNPRYVWRKKYWLSDTQEIGSGILAVNVFSLDKGFLGQVVYYKKAWYTMDCDQIYDSFENSTRIGEEMYHRTEKHGPFNSKNKAIEYLIAAPRF